VIDKYWTYTFNLSADETTEVMRLAEEQSRAAGSLYECTSQKDHSDPWAV
jgi:hypothetical protein